MPWDLFGPGSAQGGGSMETRFQRLERRVGLLEQPAVSPANVSSDFAAHEEETIFIAAPLAGLSGLLPAPTSRNRGVPIHLVFQTENPVLLRAVSGTVNGQATLRRAAVGSCVAISDGSSGWWLEGLDYERPRNMHLQDWFQSGDTTSGSIGALGWNLLGAGTPAVTRNGGALRSSNKLTMTTTAAANDRTVLALGSSETMGVCLPDEVTLLQAVWNFNSVTTNKRVFFGMYSSFAQAPTSVGDALGFMYDSSIGANYLLVARTGSSGSPTDTGVPVVSTSSDLLTMWQITPGTWRFYLNGRLLGTLTGQLIVPTQACNIGFRLETLTTVAKTHRVAYFGLRALGVAGPYDDDEFLKM